VLESPGKSAGSCRR